MDASTRECPQCGFDYMEFYETAESVRYICPDCGHEVVEDKKKKSGKRDQRGFTKKQSFKDKD